MAFNVIYSVILRNKFSRNSKRIRNSIIKLRRGFKNLRGEINKLGPSMKNVAQAMGVALAAAFVQMIRLGSRFQDSLADLSAITGATGRDLKFLRDEAFKLGKATGKSGSEVLTAFKLVASAKPELLENSKALAEVTDQVLLLANASGIELTSAANITAQGLNIFGAGADQASRFVNVLAAGAKFGASEIADTGEAMLIAGPAARAAGLSFEQLNAAIQATALGGIKGSRAGTALNAILGRLQRAGIDFKEVGLEGSFKLVKERMDSLSTSTERAQFTAKIFGEEHGKVGLAILNNVGMLTKFENKLTGTNVAQEQANIRLSTFNAKARQLGTIIEEKLVASFELMEPLLSALLVGTGALIEVIGTLINNVIIKPLKIIGTLIGKILGFIVSGFDISGFEGTFGELKNIIVGSDSKSTVDINVNSPADAVKSVQSKSTGDANLNVGLNMVATAQ